MYTFLKLIFLLGFIGVQAQDPRKRFLTSYPLDEIELNKNEDEELPCSTGMCVKRSSGQEEFGPFWANRGKKDFSYKQEPLYVEEPSWILMRTDETFQEEPFFTSRGKKDTKGTKYFNNLRLRDRREFANDVDSPFFAARGKRIKTRNDKL